MFGSAILEVAIGLIFVYLVLGTIASHINELIAGYFGWRAQDLAQGIRTLLADPALADKVLKHPLINGLRPDPKRDPSYIPAQIFALALFDTLVPERKGAPDLAALRTGAAGLSAKGPAGPALVGIIDAAGDVQKARTGVEDWFNAAMDRVSGVYKRRIQWVTLAVAFGITLIIGADSIAIATTLSQEQGVRAALTGAAQTAAPSGLEDAVNTLSQFGLPLGWLVLPQTIFGWFLKSLGLLITAAAVSLGAPFWFDLLNRITNTRSSGPKPRVSTPAGAAPSTTG